VLAPATADQLKVIELVVIALQVTVGVRSGLIVIACVVVQPPKFIYCIVAGPPEIPVTSPKESTEAVAGVNEIHGVIAFGNKEPSSCKVPPAQVEVPNVVAIVGNVLTFTFSE
jgi:hypothetical protein